MAASSCNSRGERRPGADPDILIVEPFYCGSHKQLVDCLVRDEVIGPRVHLVTMSGKKWHWRARVSALHLTSAIPVNHNFRVLFSSSVLNLAELVALRKDLASLHKVLYFHENQLQYPVQKQKDRDFQYGYNQILSCLVADSILFNSAFNMESFLTSITSFLKLMPDYRPKGLPDILRPKCSVVYFPMQYPANFHGQLKHPDHFSRSMPKVQMSPGKCSHDSKQNDDRPICPPTKGQQKKHTDNDHVSVSQIFQTQSSSDSDMCGSLMHNSTDFKVHADKAKNRTELHPQAKVGRLDCELAADTAESSSYRLALQTQDSGGDFKYPKYHIHEAGSPTGSCAKRAGPSTVQCMQNNDGSAFPLDVKVETNMLSPDKAPSDPHCHREIQQSVSSCKHDVGMANKEKEGCLHIVWPHRWEHDKDPEAFFQTLFRLQDENLQFLVSVLGETFTDVPDIFAEAEQRLKGHICSWGYQSDKCAYFNILQQADVVVSTSKHEFFGVAMLEAAYLGCYPLCPKSLVYPELYPDECMYSTPNQLYKRLRTFCKHPHLARHNTLQMDFQRFSWDTLRTVYLSKLQINT